MKIYGQAARERVITGLNQIEFAKYLKENKFIDCVSGEYVNTRYIISWCKEAREVDV